VIDQVVDKTIGIVAVAAFAANDTRGDLVAAITATRRRTRQSIEVILGSAVRDYYVVAFQTQTKSTQTVQQRVRGPAVEKSDHRHHRLLRARRERPPDNPDAKRANEFTPPDMDRHATLPWGSCHAMKTGYHVWFVRSPVSPLTLQYSP
jgi:hypothetical protein